LLSTPADEGITGPDFPGRSAKEQAGQIATITVPNQIAQVLARRAAVAQVVMLRQMTNKGVGLRAACEGLEQVQCSLLTPSYGVSGE
jgi:hypothetical protein